MKKNVLNEVYEYLREVKAVENESEFSTDWLFKSECYMRSLRFKKSQPSIGTLAICASKLNYYGNKFNKNSTNNDIALKLLKLSEDCTRQVNYLSNS